MTCVHLPSLPAFNKSKKLYKDECLYCYQSKNDPNGIDICLTCYQSYCSGPNSINHKDLHFKKTNHSVYLNLKETQKKKEKEETMTKLVIKETNSNDFEIKHELNCVGCNLHNIKVDSKAQELIDQVLLHSSSIKENEIKAWEEQIITCEHILCLEQNVSDSFVLNESCHDCSLHENIWMCLTCGNSGCGRRQFDGSGGNNHGIDHFKATGHPVSCKLGTITPEGDGDVYCYVCEEMRKDDDLGEHLKNLHLNISLQKKSGKTLAELQLEQNLKYDFSMVTQDGVEFAPVSGPGLTGLKNLGNSCYLASIVQVLFKFSNIQETYFYPFTSHIESCTKDPTECHMCQFGKIGFGLLSGLYKSISPALFKIFIGRNSDFASMRQQDAFDFYQHCLNVMEQEEKRLGLTAASKSTQFKIMEKLQCQNCSRVKYNEAAANAHVLPVPEMQGLTLEQCFEMASIDDNISYNCPNCKTRTTATKRYYFKSFPDYLVLNMRRFCIKNGMHAKLDTAVQVPETLNLEIYRKTAQDEGELLLPESSDAFIPNAEFLEQLLGMGFPKPKCEMALKVTNNESAEQAMNWIFEHIDDEILPDSAPSVNPESISMLTSMGFTEKQAVKALQATNQNLDRAVDWLFSHQDDNSQESNEIADSGAANFKLVGFVSHKGTSIHCGHYVAHLFRDEKWIIFNDEKVAHNTSPPFEDAYIYFYERIK